MSVDVHEVIRLANLHPRVNILNLGIGVGGYCLPKDGWILLDSIIDDEDLAELIPTARRANDSMPRHSFERIYQLY
jgi:UDP-N-acetyl-D-mannosaminuronic acid dehydrogenase